MHQSDLKPPPPHFLSEPHPYPFSFIHVELFFPPCLCMKPHCLLTLPITFSSRLEVAERREEQADELARLRSLLSEMSAEHERLQQRLAEGQEEIDRLVHQQQQQPPPPPDVTAGGPAVAAGSQHQQQQQQQPDVAALRGQHGNPPDLMPGEFTKRTYIH